MLSLHTLLLASIKLWGIFVNNGYSPMSSNQQNVSVEHDIIMRGRRVIDITGVKQVESFDSEEFLLETVMGFLTIRGQNLQMKNLDVEKGVVSIKGKIHEMLYIDENQGEKTKGFLVSCLNESNNSVVYNAFDDRNGCLDWSIIRYIPTFLKRQERKRWLVFIHDILFWVVQALFVFYVLLLVNEAELRIYVFLALLCGFAAYQSLLKALYMRLLNFLIYIFVQNNTFLFELYSYS